MSNFIALSQRISQLSTFDIYADSDYQTKYDAYYKPAFNSLAVERFE